MPSGAIEGGSAIVPAAIDHGRLTIADHGAAHVPAAVSAQLDAIRACLAQLPQAQAGIRIRGISGLQAHLAPTGALGVIAASLLGASCRPVRAILFDKCAQTNWALGWHQDRTICVSQRIETLGFGPWTIKQSMHHVAPPADLLARMLTMRVHLDDVPAHNAPLLVALGSHALGRIDESEIDAVVARSQVHICTATAGDVWLYATPILHASAAATTPSRRRVLQIDFAAEDLPGQLAWLGV